MLVINIMIYSLVAGLSTVFGVYLVRYFNDWTKRNAVYLISFAVGVLLANAIFHLLPEAIELTNNWMWYLLSGIIVLFITEHIITIHTCREPEGCEIHTLGTVSVIGIMFHSLVDGIIIGIGFEVSTTVGILSAIAIIAHEIPEGIFTYTLLKHSNFSESRNLLLSWLVALATPFGTIVTLALIRNLPSSSLGALMALAAGTFLYIGASDLTPEVHKKSRILNIFLILFGITFIITLGRIIE